MGLRSWILLYSLFAVVVAQFIYGKPAFAHGFGDRYDLPVPLWLYITGAGLTVAFSFVVIGAYLRGISNTKGYPSINLASSRLVGELVLPKAVQSLKIIAVLGFFLVVLSGLLGNQTPTKNLAPTTVWVIWWVGFAYVSALLGNLWSLANPWKTIFEWSDNLLQRLRKGEQLSLQLNCPNWLGSWPAVVLFIIFAWIELISDYAAQPKLLAVLILIYSLITWMGMLIFGKDKWLRHGEFFSIIFYYLSCLAPMCGRLDLDKNPGPDQNISLGSMAFENDQKGDVSSFRSHNWYVRPPGSGLLHLGKSSYSEMVFILLFLSTVTFDGITATPFWNTILFNAYLQFQSIGSLLVPIMNTIGLLLLPMVFIMAYLLFATLMRLSSASPVKVINLARTFVYSLIPIALAYHLAHYLSFLLIHGQLIIPLASDPLGIGWDLLGTADYRVNIGIINAKIAWFLGVGAIVAGHVVAVYLAHFYAIQLFSGIRIAIRSQYPLLVLMVGYTMISLWILAQPIVERMPDA